MERKLYWLLITLAFFNIKTSAQDFSNKGKEFWLAYSYHVGMVNSAGGSPAMTLYLTSDVNTAYKVEVFGAATLQSGNINAGQVVTVNVPSTYFINDEGLFNNRAIRITGDKPIVVYSFITRAAASAATLCLPTNVLGREYISTNFTQISNEQNSHSFITIVGVEDNTTVEIKPTANTKNGWLAGNTYTVNLNKGTIYQVLGAVTGNNGVDLTGTRVRSIASGTGGCKRIAVFSGSGKMYIGCTSGGAGADNLYQQLYPVGTWGKKFLTAPSFSRPNNYYRIIKNSAATNVYLNGTLIPAGSWVNNTYYEFLNNRPNLIEADEPISVAQYFTSQNCNGNNGNYDPDMIVLNPVEQNIDKVTLVNSSLVNSPAQHHVHVIMRNGGTGISSFKLDGNTVPASSWTTHPSDPNFSYAYLNNVSQGFHRLESDSGFNAVVYGYANVETYGYSAGANVKDLYQFVSIQNQFATVNFPATCQNSPFFFSMTFPYQPTQIRWVFGPTLNAMGIADVTLNSPSPDSTWTLNGKQLYRYKLSGSAMISTPGTYPIKVLAQNPTSDGCSGEQEINYDVQVYDKPKADFSFVNSGCVSDSVRFTENSTTAGRPATQWFWDFADGTSSQVRNPAHKYAIANSYLVKFSTVTDIGCLSDTAEKTIVLSEPPVAKFGISAPYCVGKTITFSDSSSATGSTITKWTWDFGDGSAPVVVNANAPQTHSFPNPGPYTISLTVENSVGCKSVVFSRIITVSPNPVADFRFGKACLPNAVVSFNDASTISDGSQNFFLYSWNFGDGIVSSQKNPAHPYNSVGPFTVALQVTSAAGCVASITKTVDSIYAQPQASFTTANEQCLGTAFAFADQSSAAQSTVTGWQWDFGDGTAPVTSQSPTYNYTAAGNYIVSLTATSAVGCVSAPFTKPITVNAIPQADFNPALPSCVTRTINFSDNSTVASGTVSKWTWNFGDGSGTSTQQSPSYIYNSTGPFNVSLQVESGKGCVSTTVTKQIVVNPLPVPGFIMPGNCINDPVSQFTDTSSIADGTEAQFSYLWNFGDQNATASNPNTSTAKNGSHSYTATGNYNVTMTVTSNAGCSASVTQVFTINGAVPLPAFTVRNGTEHCSSDSIFITDNSAVNPGRLVKLEIYWDHTSDPTNKTVIDNPVPGATYSHKYPEFFSPATQRYVIRIIPYSGVNCLSTLDQTITLKASPQISFPPINAMCANAQPVQITAGVTNMTNGAGVFSGTGVAAAGLFNPTVGAGTYAIRYTYTGTNGCASFREEPLTVNPVPTINAGPDRFVLEGGTATLVTTANGSGLTYVWSPGAYLNNPAIASPVVTPRDDVNYTVTVTSADGCSASDQVFVKLLKLLEIPNVFSPNNDGVNDRWVIKYLESYPGATIEIFNRYGQKVYQSVGYSKPWDGTYKGNQVPAGTYYYIINPKNGRQQFAGYVDIIR
jgi:gliding motility-associated-like protein